MDMNNETIQFSQSTDKPHLKNVCCGLFVGKNTLADATAKLGEYTAKIDIANGSWYEFFDGVVKVFVLSSEAKITKIRVYSKYLDCAQLPSNKADLFSKYGAFTQSNINEFGIVQYDSPGIRATCNVFSDPVAVEWIEFY